MINFTLINLFFISLLIIGYHMGSSAFQLSGVVACWLAALFIKFCDDESKVWTFRVEKKHDKKVTSESYEKFIKGNKR